MPQKKAIVPVGKIEQRILLIRGEKVIIDADLAEFYGVPTKRLNEQVKRNKARFPDDFMFQLSTTEKAEVVANCDHLSKLKFSKTLPYAFTEHGSIMAASVLNSKRAVEVSVYIVRAFVKIRRMIAEHKELSRKIVQIERHLADHDEQIIELIKVIKQLLKPEAPPKKRRIGFHSDKH
jgi:ORF6N domain